MKNISSQNGRKACDNSATSSCDDIQLWSSALQAESQMKLFYEFNCGVFAWPSPRQNSLDTLAIVSDR